MRVFKITKRCLLNSLNILVQVHNNQKLKIIKLKKIFVPN